MVSFRARGALIFLARLLVWLSERLPVCYDRQHTMDEQHAAPVIATLKTGSNLRRNVSFARALKMDTEREERADGLAVNLTVHCQQRLIERAIPVDEVLAVLASAEVPQSDEVQRVVEKDSTTPLVVVLKRDARGYQVLSAYRSKMLTFSMDSGTGAPRKRQASAAVLQEPPMSFSLCELLGLSPAKCAPYSQSCEHGRCKLQNAVNKACAQRNEARVSVVLDDDGGATVKLTCVGDDRETASRALFWALHDRCKAVHARLDACSDDSGDDDEDAVTHVGRGKIERAYHRTLDLAYERGRAYMGTSITGKSTVPIEARMFDMIIAVDKAARRRARASPLADTNTV